MKNWVLRATYIQLSILFSSLLLTTALISSLAFSDSNAKPSLHWGRGIRTKLKVKTKALLSPDVSCQLCSANLTGFSNGSGCATPVFLNLNVNLSSNSSSYLLVQTRHLLLLPKLKIRHSNHLTVNKPVSIALIFLGFFQSSATATIQLH